jgi:hypothetical protein
MTTVSSVGPHEGRELELMLSGSKPLSMFVEPIPPEFDVFPEEEFHSLVAQGRLVKEVSIETLPGPGDKKRQVRRVLYALPGEEWRIRAVLLVQHLYTTLPGWPDLDRVIGILLGYERRDIEQFVETRKI